MATRVDELLQLLADLEEREPLGGHRNRLPSSRIATVVGLVGADAEAPIPTDFNTFPLLKRLGHGLEDAVDHELSPGLGELAASRDGFDEFALRHPGFASLGRGPSLRECSDLSTQLSTLFRFQPGQGQVVDDGVVRGRKAHPGGSDKVDFEYSGVEATAR